ncbi:synaptogyrin-like [Oppia nitens]|uniref:synaptogyrin-like n=1 Tax=Oppia nitens TaxID=1686743 RepID=UPI0023DCB2B8|nr:synaptogyrin-like [Oppia nitens]
MNNMNAAFGAAKAGSAFDPIGYVMRPQVILRFICWLCSVIVFGCISAKGWYKEGKLDKCLYNKDNNACRLGSGLGLIGFLASIAFLVLEALFQNLSSIKIRRRVVAFDLGFSGVWSVLYLICFAYLGIAWAKSDYPPFGEGINSCRAAIAFSFFSIASWAGCTYFAHQRWVSGTDMTQFASGFENEDIGGGGAGYSAYGGATDEPTYQENPFTNMPPSDQMSNINYTAPTY